LQRSCDDITWLQKIFRIFWCDLWRRWFCHTFCQSSLARHLLCVGRESAVYVALALALTVSRLPSNIAFKPKLHRYAVNMAERACHVASYALQFGLT
jgi:hypothetical protein